MEKKENQQKSIVSEKDSANKRTIKAPKESVWSFIATIVVILLIGVGLYVYTESTHKENYDRLESINTDLSNNLAYRDSLINQWILAFNEIEKDLITMQEKEALLKFDSSDPELTKDVRERVISEIKQINTLLRDNKAKIAALNKKLKKSGVEIAALNKKVIQLEDAVEERDRSLADLKFQLIENDFVLKDLNQLIDSLDYQLIRKNQEIVEKDQKIEKQESKLSRAYYALGDKKELKEKGLMKKEGGFLGLFGKVKTVSTTLSDEEFNKIDINKTNLIAINSKKARLISDHPKSAYEFVSNDSLIAYIKIKDPEQFWKITKYAVIETNK